MFINDSSAGCRTWAPALALALCALAASCDSQDPIFGNSGTAALVPAVIAETPLNGATNVLTSTTVITATLNEAVAPITGAASMTVTCAAPCVNATGTVTLDATHTIATFTLTHGTVLAGFTKYTGTVHLGIHDSGVAVRSHPAPSIGDRSRDDHSRADCWGAQQHRHQRRLHQGYGTGHAHRGQLYRDLHGALCLAHRQRELFRRRENRGIYA